jgi:hypothetical protein
MSCHEARNFHTRRSRFTSPTRARLASVKLSSRLGSSLRGSSSDSSSNSSGMRQQGNGGGPVHLVRLRVSSR